MYRSSFIICLLIIGVHSVFAQATFYPLEKKKKQGYVVTAKGETVHGKVHYENGDMEPPFVTVREEGKEKRKFSLSDVKFFYFDSLRFEPMPKKPWADKYYVIFMPILMQNDSCKIYLDGHTSGSDAVGPVNSYRYHLYVNDKFKQEITKKNYRELLHQYFTTCDALFGELERKKNYFDYGALQELATFYRQNCP